MDTWVLKLLKDYKQRRTMNMSQSWLKNTNINLRFAFGNEKRNEAYLELSARDMASAKDTITWIREQINTDKVELTTLKEGLQYLKTHGQRLDAWKVHLILVGAFLGIVAVHAGNANSMAAAGVFAGAFIIGLILAAERLEMHYYSGAVKELISFMEFIIAEFKVEKDTIKIQA